MLGIVTSDGKRMPSYWFLSGLKITTEVYLDVMERVVKAWIEANYAGVKYDFQQDSAAVHRAKRTQVWLANNLADHWPGQCGLLYCRTARRWTMGSMDLGCR